MPTLVFSPARALFYLYITAILTGTILLSLPFATAQGTRASLMVALFTATSATCVTGLVVENTGFYWSIFGQMVIMSLIFLGGLGLLTAGTMVSIVLGRHISYRQRMSLAREKNLGPGGLVRLVRSIALMASGIQILGAIILSLVFRQSMAPGPALYYGIFHSISAFNNAGFDLFSASLQEFQLNPAINSVFLLLFVAGGFGFTVLNDLSSRRWKSLSLNTRVVISASLVLILAGALIFLIFEGDNVLAPLSVGERLLVALFQSATARTAGFSTVDFGQLEDETLFFTIILMFIGASPASTGGGIKTTAAVLLLAGLIGGFWRGEETVIFRRSIPGHLYRKSLILFFLALILVISMVLFISILEEEGFMAIMFEVTSAFATVGLSTGITGYLGEVSKLLLIMTMIAGRLGPVNLIEALGQYGRKKRPIHFPEEDLIIG